ncbi:hypothetical protein DFH27DRAFT_618560 [Peziza echinospora]|nr:hypothetical protein DFH27DRAFT_618560 [Peziza echinospora]
MPPIAPTPMTAPPIPPTAPTKPVDNTAVQSKTHKLLHIPEEAASSAMEPPQMPRKQNKREYQPNSVPGSIPENSTEYTTIGHSQPQRVFKTPMSSTKRQLNLPIAPASSMDISSIFGQPKEINTTQPAVPSASTTAAPPVFKVPAKPTHRPPPPALKMPIATASVSKSTPLPTTTSSIAPTASLLKGTPSGSGMPVKGILNKQKVPFAEDVAELTFDLNHAPVPSRQPFGSAAPTIPSVTPRPRKVAKHAHNSNPGNKTSGQLLLMSASGVAISQKKTPSAIQSSGTSVSTTSDKHSTHPSSSGKVLGKRLKLPVGGHSTGASTTASALSHSLTGQLSKASSSKQVPYGKKEIQGKPSATNLPPVRDSVSPSTLNAPRSAGGESGHWTPINPEPQIVKNYTEDSTTSVLIDSPSAAKSSSNHSRTYLSSTYWEETYQPIAKTIRRPPKSSLVIDPLPRNDPEWKPSQLLRTQSNNALIPLSSQQQSPRNSKIDALGKVAAIYNDIMKITPLGRHIDSLTSSSATILSKVVLSMEEVEGTDPNVVDPNSMAKGKGKEKQ